ncbi:hypothetical protein TNCV_3092131 [Trichonephila clavipes]|uniref:Uncharacterized protein n=1 Tax=Trichonephila clavipes TaxID=2585209 RepID=A0A8X6RXA7_TRICX|nr:hypothetical protein TNCV_3092131 [Trichonephila clavipes]
MAALKPVKQKKNRVKSGHRPFSPLTLLQQFEFTPALTFFPTCSDFWLDFPPVVRMACEIKLLESEATTGFFVLLGEQGNKAVLDWVMKEGLIHFTDMSVRSVKRICVWLNERVRLMVLNGVVEYSRKRIPTLFAGV